MAEPLRERVLGRVVAVDVFKPNVLEPVVSRGTLLDEDWFPRLEQTGIERVMVRSAISCESRYGICALTVSDEESVLPGQRVAHWDPHTIPVITQVAGQVNLVDVVDGVTVNMVFSDGVE
ncbi:hypothetical protein PN36_31430 [Candidatus Thiomargarita nelsonii]|uniref:Uncharacterized protein n=1 Tax=Candidatus Thiomargarita nelsonii TaxID=1003181 RepID=A0A4E0QLK4_9GAMM|nr:hypothetical protein PN36_31430 [Candidatus Thiomargarita nelsonii]